VRIATTAALVLLLGGCATTPALVDSDPHPQDGNITAAVMLELDEAIADRVGPADDDRTDWKTFRLRTAARVEVRFIAAGPIELNLYEEDGAHVGSLTGGGGQQQAFVANLAPGRYLVEVSAEGELSAIDYTLVVEELL
jgi:hypothetical protein